MRISIIALFLITLTSCKTTDQNKSEEIIYSSFFAGTYTGEKSDGIYKYSIDKNGKIKLTGLVAKSQNPSFLTLSADKKYLIAVNEISDENGMGSVETYRIYDDSLAFISRSSSGGANPCYVSSNKENYVLTANYSGGNVGLLKLDTEGRLSELLDVEQHSGQGTTDRQKGPHAHSAMFDPESDIIISADLGTNELWLSKIDIDRNKMIPAYPHKFSLDPGAGPRHMAFHPNGNFLYVINELNNTVSTMKRNEEKLFVKGSSVSTLPPGYKGESYCADVHVSSDGKFLYASNRGHDTIAIFKIIPENGKLIPVGHQSVHGEWPRNFALSPNEDFLLVANQNSENIVSFKRNSETGLLDFSYEIDCGSPVCIQFF